VANADGLEEVLGAPHVNDLLIFGFLLASGFVKWCGPSPWFGLLLLASLRAAYTSQRAINEGGKMLFVTTAFAQGNTAASVEASLGIVEYGMLVVGVIILAIGLYGIHKKVDVSIGQAIIIGAGLALCALPFVTTFEWSDKGFKFTTRSETSELAAQVANLASDGTKAREDLKLVTEALKATTERIAQLEASKTGEATPPSDPNTNFKWGKVTNPTFFDDLMIRNESGLKASNRNLGQIETLQKSLQAAPN
jgi:hypothetical protein